MKSNLYSNLDELLEEEKEKLNAIYEELLEDNEDKSAIKKFDRIVKSNIDYKGLLPCSKSFHGENLLTISKLWMILILLKITKGKSQQIDFLTLINSSLTHELNEYIDYKEFFNERCELLFSDEEAINQINLNQKLKNKIDLSITHDELKDYYIYLLYRPYSFQKVSFDGMEKSKKIDIEENKNKKRKSANSNKDGKDSRNKTKVSNRTSIRSKNVIETSEDEDDEKGDRLDENDMVSKNRGKGSSKPDNKKTKTSSNKRKKKEKSRNDEDDSDYDKIYDIINKREKSVKKKDDNKKSAKKQNKKISIKSRETREENEIEEDSINEEDNNKKNKKDKNKSRYSSISDKKNKNKTKKNNTEEKEENSTRKSNKKKVEKEKEKEKKKEERSNRKSNKYTRKKKQEDSDRIFELLGLRGNDEGEIKEEINNKKGKNRKSASMPPQKIEKNKGKEKTELQKKGKKKEKEEEKKKEKEKEKEKGKDNKNKKTPKNSSIKKEKNKKRKKKSKNLTDDEDSFDEDEEDDLSNFNFSDSDIVQSDLDKISADEKIQMEKEIQAAMNGDEDMLDLEELLEGSKLEGISLSQFNSKESSSKDLDEIDED